MKTCKNLIFWAFISFLPFITGCGTRPEQTPNVVIIVVDTLRADHLPFYGYRENTSPFLSKLAKQSVVFNRAFSASSWTAPATASIFTSMYPFQHRVVSNMLANWKFNEGLKKEFRIKLNRIPKQITTLAEIFKEKGYATFGIADNVNIGKKEGFEQGFDKLATYNYTKAFAITEKLLKWRKEIQSKDKYFLYIHFMDPHTPLHERKKWLKKRKLKDVEKGMETDEINKIKRYNTVLRYDSEINLVDRMIEKLYRKYGWSKNTLIVFTSDHGEELWEHGAFGHGYSLFKEVIHVPLFFYYPEGNFETGYLKNNVSTIDILPTLRDFIGLKKDELNEGISLLNTLKRGESDDNSRILYSHLLKRKLAGKRLKKNSEAYSVIHKNRHYIKSLTSLDNKFKQYLFNMKIDFKESENIFSLQDSLETVKKLKRFYIKFYKSCKKFKQNMSNYTSNKKEMKRLKTLGYVE